MPVWSWALIAVAVVVVLAVAVWRAFARRRTAGLQDRFGPEYDRTVDASGSTREAEAELAEREKRVSRTEKSRDRRRRSARQLNPLCPWYTFGAPVAKAERYTGRSMAVAGPATSMRASSPGE